MRELIRRDAISELAHRTADSMDIDTLRLFYIDTIQYGTLGYDSSRDIDLEREFKELYDEDVKIVENKNQVL